MYQTPGMQQDHRSSLTVTVSASAYQYRATHLPSSNQDVTTIEKVSEIFTKLWDTEDCAASVVVKTAASNDPDTIHDPQHGPRVLAERFRDRFIVCFGVEQVSVKRLLVCSARQFRVVKVDLFLFTIVEVRRGGRHCDLSSLSGADGGVGR